MVHNGIEYGDMQLIAEAYDLLKHVAHLNNEQIAHTFETWNTTELESFLIEITAKIFKKKDRDAAEERQDEGKETGKEKDADAYLVDKILDQTGQKGTGRWTIQDAAELGVAVPTISAALDARNLSALREQRCQAARILHPPPASNRAINKDELINDIKQALYAAKICSYTQGMNLIAAAAKVHGWQLNLGEIARIWKGGCIIRARFLDRIKTAYTRARESGHELPSLLVDPEFASEMNERQMAMRRVVSMGVLSGVSVGALSASLAYFDAYRRDALPANLTQAQRDFFGAHTYQRVDREGVYHTEWTQEGKGERKQE